MTTIKNSDEFEIQPDPLSDCRSGLILHTPGPEIRLDIPIVW